MREERPRPVAEDLVELGVAPLEYLAGHRDCDPEAAKRHQDAEPPKVECEGVTARWCPNCGDCACGPRHDLSGPVDAEAFAGCEGGEECLCYPLCPLHGEASPHPIRPAECRPEAKRPKRRGVARLKVFAQLDRGAPTRGVLELDRGSKTVRVRARGSRKVYELPADLVASIIVAKVIKADVAALHAAHGKRPRRRRGIR